MNKSEIDIVFDAYSDGFETAANDSDTLLAKCSRHYSLLHLSYLTAIILSILIFLSIKTLCIEQFGPILIILSTLLTGLHIIIVQRIIRFFDINDPAYGSMHLKRFKGRAEKNEHYGLRYKMSTNNYLSREKCGKIISRSIFWEIVLASIGTFVWGFL